VGFGGVCSGVDGPVRQSRTSRSARQRNARTARQSWHSLATHGLSRRGTSRQSRRERLVWSRRGSEGNAGQSSRGGYGQGGSAGPGSRGRYGQGGAVWPGIARQSCSGRGAWRVDAGYGRAVEVRKASVERTGGEEGKAVLARPGSASRGGARLCVARQSR